MGDLIVQSAISFCLLRNINSYEIAVFELADKKRIFAASDGKKAFNVSSIDRNLVLQINN